MKILMAMIMPAFLSLALAARAAELAAIPSPTAINECLGKTGSSECLDLLFRAGLATHSPGDILKSIQNYGDDDPKLRLSCHPIVHALGREIFGLKGNVHDAFMARRAAPASVASSMRLSTTPGTRAMPRPSAPRSAERTAHTATGRAKTIWECSSRNKEST